MEKPGTQSAKSKTKRVTQLEKIITETENNVKKLDITKFIEDNPVAKLSGTYQSEVLNKIKNEFGEFDQRVFLFNFYCSFNFDEENDFVIDLNQVWPWMGFTKKGHAKRLLEKEFEENVDYIIKTASPKREAVSLPQNGGQNKERILLNVETFKLFCMTAKKPKAKLIRRYYVKLENLIQQVINKQSDEMKNLLCSKEEENKQLQQELEKTKEMVITTKEETMIKSFDKKQTIYIGYVEEGLRKFGYSDDIRSRVYCHKSDKYGFGPNFRIEFVIDSIFNIPIERMIKDRLKERIISKEYNGNNQTELILIDSDFTDKMLYDEIKKYKRLYENFERIEEITKENEQLKNKISKLECRYQELENRFKEATGEIPVEYKVIKDEKLEMEIKEKVTFLEFVQTFVTEYKNIDKLEDCKFYENEKDVIMIEKDDFYNIYEEYIKQRNLLEFKFVPDKIANYIPMDSKTIPFLHMKTKRINRTVNKKKFRPTVRIFYINKLKEYIPKKIKELKLTNTEKQIKIEIKNESKSLNESRKKQKLYKFVKSILENFPEYTAKMKQKGLYRVPYDKFYEDYQNFDPENDLCPGKFGEYLNEIGVVQTKYDKSKSYKKINKALVEQKLDEVLI